MDRSMRRGVVAAAVLLGAGGFFLAPWIRDVFAAPAATGAVQDEPGGGIVKHVEVVRPRRQRLAREVVIPHATIESFERVEIAARVDGYVADVRVEIGDRVRQGDVLAVLDVPELEKDRAETQAELDAKEARLEAARSAGVAAAQAKVESARAQQRVGEEEVARQTRALRFEEQDFARRAALHADGALPDDAFEAARLRLDDARAAESVARAELAGLEAGVRDSEAALAVAQAQVAVAQAEAELARARVARLDTLLSFARVAAPFDGVVTRRMVDRGALVTAGASGKGTMLFELHRDDRMRLAVEMPESDVALVSPGTAARVEPFAFGGAALEATVSRLASALKLSTRTMRIELDLDNAGRRLSHGMAARVLFELDPREDALTIPAAALVVEGGATSVLVVVDDVVERRAVELGLDDGLTLEVTSGLEDGDLVIVAGKGLVDEGARVNAVVKE